jgi:nucleotide-binding universal stress UspA family protein
MKTTKAALRQSDGAVESLAVTRILHPTDLADTSIRALTVAIKLARQNHAELLLAHALPPPIPIYEIESADQPSAQANLEVLVDRLSREGIRSSWILIKGNRPVPANIAECAKLCGADLIVLGTQSRRGLARYLRGSIAASVVKVASCPVLVVPSR